MCCMAYYIILIGAEFVVSTDLQLVVSLEGTNHSHIVPGSIGSWIGIEGRMCIKMRVEGSSLE